MIMPSFQEIYRHHQPILNIEKLPAIGEDIRDMRIDEFDHGRIVQLRDNNGNKLFPISSGDMELMRNYTDLADRVLYLEHKLEALEKKLRTHDSGIAKII